MTTNRQFGIEIEGFGITREAACRAIRAVGVDVEIEGYNHHTRPQWKIVTDSSVTNTGTGLNYGGWEVVSPILRGEEGLAEVAKVAEALDRAGAKVDRSCGFHVHVDARDLQANEIMTVVRRYAEFETKIDSFMPASRRGDSNSFCQSMGQFLNRYPVSSSSIDRLRNDVYNYRCRDDARYWKVNLQAFLRHGTIEFRQHSGTRNAQKMVNWVRFCLGFVEASRKIAAQTARPVVQDNSIDATSPARHPRFRNLTCAQQKIANRLHQGPATVSELCAVAAASRNGYNGVTEQTLYSYISEIRAKLGLEIKKRRGGGYYIVSSAPTAVPVQAPQIEDSLFLDIPVEVVSFYEERAQEFAC